MQSRHRRARGGGARLYGLLLRLYPRPFRDAYRAELIATFQAQRREPRYRRPLRGRILFWFDILTDLMASATRRRLASKPVRNRFPRKREGLVGTWIQDIKYAARGLAKNPGVTAAALLTLAIGIGANTAMFSLVDVVLLRPFPYPEPDRLVMVWDSNPARGWDRFAVSPSNFLDYREQSVAIERMTAYFNGSTTLTGADAPERLPATMVGPDYFQTFGIEPQLGRAFGPEDNEPGRADVAILSDGLWRRRFGADPGVIGETIHAQRLAVRGRRHLHGARRPCDLR